MMLVHLSVTGFRGIESYKTHLDTVNVFFGPNGAGKTTIAQAIQMILHGRCALTTKDGKGFQNLIGDKAGHAILEAITSYGLLTMELGKKRMLTATDSNGEVIDYPANPEAIVAAMPEVFLDSGELDGILAKILLKTIPREDVVEAAGEYGPWLVGRLPKTLTAETLTEVGKQAYDDRTEINREIKAINVRLEEYGFDRPVVDSNGNKRTPDEVPKIKTQLDRLHEKIDLLNRERGAAEAAPDKEALQAERDALGLPELATERTSAGNTYEYARKTYEAAKRAYDDLMAELKKAQESADKPAYVCEKCGHSPVVDVDTTELEAAIDAIDLETAYQSMTDAEADWADVKRRHDEGLARAKEIDAALKTECGSVNAVDEELETTRAAIERGEWLIEELQRAGNIDGEKRRLAECEEQVERLTWCVKAFRDGELTKQFIGDAATEFVATLNETMNAFGHECNVVVDGKTVNLTFNGRPTAYCSEGERLLVQLCLALAFAKRTGWPAIIDNVNHLDAVNRKKMLTMLRESDVQVFVFCAWQQSSTDLDPVRKALEPCRIVWIDKD